MSKNRQVSVRATVFPLRSQTPHCLWGSLAPCPTNTVNAGGQSPLMHSHKTSSHLSTDFPTLRVSPFAQPVVMPTKQRLGHPYSHGSKKKGVSFEGLPVVESGQCSHIVLCFLVCFYKSNISFPVQPLYILLLSELPVCSVNPYCNLYFLFPF